MKCTVCGGKTTVMQTRTSPTYLIRSIRRCLEQDVDKYGLQKRRHHCTECPHRFTTYEMDEELINKLLGKASQDSNVNDALFALREALGRIDVK